MRDRDHATKVAVVTGANRGIGLEVCRQLALAGVRVVLTGRDSVAVDAAAADLRAQGLDASPAVMDVADEDSVRACARDVIAQFVHVDILVNNAGVLIDEDRELLAIPIDHFRATFETNVLGAIAVSQTFVPAMIERRSGSVVNVSSGAGQLSSMGTYAPAYSISKAALNAFTIQLAASTRGSGVIVNCVDPGWVRTRMGGPEASRSVQDGADTIVWLALQKSSGPTGKFFRQRRVIDW
jgi:NAD(P)-dependent dehydrogenase (short-subunit alcohol dehydrogenase family)